MRKVIVFPLLMLCFFLTTMVAFAQQKPTLHPGAQPYTPTRIDWLTTVLQASLRTEMLHEDGYLLQITSPDSETILIYVRYLPTVNREVMNTIIEGAREVIRITAKSYGWDKWLKVKEDIRMAKDEEVNKGPKY